MSAMTYNGVNFPYVMVTRFTQTAVGDDQGDTDWCYLKSDLTVQAILNLCHLPMIAPDVAAGAAKNPQDVANLIRSRLLQRRRRLSFTFNGINMIPEPQAGLDGVVDARNGPIPQSCDWVELNNTTILFNYNIIAHHWENNQVNAASPLTTNRIGNDVLYNRWSESVEIDQCNYTTRTRNGKFVIRSDNASAVVADLMRNAMATVGIPPGFIRQSARYTVDPSGLALEYAVTDKEAFKMPPFVAGNRIMKADGKYSEETSRGGAKKFISCTVSLEGDKYTDQMTLVETAVKIVMTKLATNGATLAKGSGSILEGAHLDVDMYENKVTFSARAMATSVRGRVARATLNYKTTATPLSEGVSTPPIHELRGSAGRVLQAAAYYDPSIITTRIVVAPGGGTQLNRGLEPGQAGLTQEP